MTFKTLDDFWNDGTVSNDHELVCPYCGYEHQDSWEFGEDGEVECCNEKCERTFSFHTNTVTTYTSKKMKEDKAE